MSDPATKIERSKAKDIRKGIVAQRSRVPPKRKPKLAQRPWLVVQKWSWLETIRGKKWCVRGRFVTEEQARIYMEKSWRELAYLKKIEHDAQRKNFRVLHVDEWKVEKESKKNEQKI